MPAVRTEQQVQRRARVVEAAMALAAKGGYEAVQMRAVSQEADVALGTIYRYFSSKDQLLLAALDQMAEDMQQTVSDDPPRGASVHERVMDVFLRCCGLLEAEPKLTHAVVTALSSSDPEVSAIAEGVRVRMRGLIAAAVAGESIPQIDDIVHVLGLVWFASMLQWVSGHSPLGIMASELELASRLLLQPTSS
jgi:TetR/AcrR family transcriptional regulator, cholesterol catabolism regulator